MPKFTRISLNYSDCINNIRLGICWIKLQWTCEKFVPNGIFSLYSIRIAISMVYRLFHCLSFVFKLFFVVNTKSHRNSCLSEERIHLWSCLIDLNPSCSSTYIFLAIQNELVCLVPVNRINELFFPNELFPGNSNQRQRQFVSTIGR